MVFTVAIEQQSGPVSAAGSLISVSVSGAPSEHHDAAASLVQLGSGPLVWALLLLFIVVRWRHKLDHFMDVVTRRVEDGDDVALGSIFRLSVGDFGSIELPEKVLDKE